MERYIDGQGHIEMTPLYDVIIPSYQEDIDSLCSALNMTHRELRITIIDNGNRDFGEQYGNQRVFPPKENIGFVKASNAGIAMSTAPYIVLMNDDTMIYNNVFDKMRLCFEKDPKLGIVGAALSGRMQHDIDRAEQDAKDCEVNFRGELLYTGMVPFTCAMLKREVIEKCDYLDESFGVGYAEDDEYCYRVRQAGFKIGIARDAYVLHRGSQTFKALYTPEQIIELKARNLEYYKKKWGLETI